MFLIYNRGTRRSVTDMFIWDWCALSREVQSQSKCWVADYLSPKIIDLHQNLLHVTGFIFLLFWTGGFQVWSKVRFTEEVQFIILKFLPYQSALQLWDLLTRTTLFSVIQERKKKMWRNHPCLEHCGPPSHWIWYIASVILYHQSLWVCTYMDAKWKFCLWRGYWVSVKEQRLHADLSISFCVVTCRGCCGSV